MKNKIIALTLTAVLALSATTAFASESVNTENSGCTKENIQYKVTLNGKTIDLKSVNWESLINKTAKTTEAKPEAEKPAATEPEAVPAPSEQPQAPIASEPVKTEPVQAPATESKNTESNAAASSNVSYEQKVVELVNVERQKNGLQPLTLDSAIANAARTKSKDMADNNYFAHQSPTYGSAGDMLTKFGIKWTAWGENIAAGQRTPEEVVTAWMNSSGHRANILNSNFTKIGVGYVTDSSGRAYWTQIFAR